jgi:hypothetical protein
MTPNPTEIGSYTQDGKEISYWIQVSFASVTNFGTQSSISLNLPTGFPAVTNYLFTQGYLLHASQQYQIMGINAVGGIPFSLWWKGSQLYLSPFTFNSPVVLVKGDFLTISGTYLTS